MLPLLAFLPADDPKVPSTRSPRAASSDDQGVDQGSHGRDTVLNARRCAKLMARNSTNPPVVDRSAPPVDLASCTTSASNCASTRSGAAAAGSGHPTSSMSAADLLAVLTVRHLRYDWSRPSEPANDSLIFSEVTSLAVRELPGSGTRDELMDAAGMTASHIADAARALRTTQSGGHK